MPVTLQGLVVVPRDSADILQPVVFDSFDPAKQLQDDVARHLAKAPFEAVSQVDPVDHGKNVHLVGVQFYLRCPATETVTKRGFA